VPLLRFRRALPVWHQVREFWQLYPAQCSVWKIVQVLTWGSPSGAVGRARCKVVSDQVAEPSVCLPPHAQGMRGRSRFAASRKATFVTNDPLGREDAQQRILDTGLDHLGAAGDPEESGRASRRKG
jgi:hypothetical protein